MARAVHQETTFGSDDPVELIQPTEPGRNRRSPASERRVARDEKFPRFGRALHVSCALLFAALGLLILMQESTIRVGEARLARMILDRFFAEDTMFVTSAGSPAIGFTFGEEWLVARVTIQCAIALYLGPVAFLAAALSLSPRTHLLRVLGATVVGMFAMIILNQLRLLAICHAWGTGGHAAFGWVHGPFGTAFMLLGLTGVLLLFFRIVMRQPSAG
ncbi:exosortase R [Leucobacter luti]|nr:exosortase R [Leucobacter luti]